MQANALIRREVFPGAVQKVEYSVTPTGMSLNEAIGVMSQWGKLHERHLQQPQDPGPSRTDNVR